MDTVIKVENLSKRYRLGTNEKADTFAERLINVATYPIRNFKRIARLAKFSDEEDSTVFWALRDINFEVKRGEVLGIIGHNGAGKSTLLKILSRITEPTTGKVSIMGRVSSLLEVGTGFHPELTGRDNIYMNGTILGMRKREIDQKFDEIVSFSGVEKHIDTPVKFYSSGMTVRLAFSVAAHLEPEVLIIDEVLAVGDAEFQKKCLGKMEDVAGQGRTVLFVSHNMGAVRNLCNSAILLKEGQIVEMNSSNVVINKYLQHFNIEINDRKTRDDFFVSSYKLEDEYGNEIAAAVTGNPLGIRFYLKGSRLIDDLIMRLQIKDADAKVISTLSNYHTGNSFNKVEDECSILCMIDKLPLYEGEYLLDLRCQDGTEIIDEVIHIGKINVIKGDFYKSGKMSNVLQGIALDHAWNA